MGWGYNNYYQEYVPVGQRKANARQIAKKRAKKQKRDVAPVEISGRTIAKTFWGKAWCDHLEGYSDYSNRLPRGRTYARNGSVVDLQISPGRIEAIVAGSDTYEVSIKISKLEPKLWKQIRNDCSASIDSLLDLLAGRFSDGVMERLTDRAKGLFPSPREIDLDCDCPDAARLCKHLAAVLYGIGAHLDKSPELLFQLRDVDHAELVSEAVSEQNLDKALGKQSSDLAGEDLGAVFGIELDSFDTEEQPQPKKKNVKKKAKKKSAQPAKKRVRKAAAKKKSPKKKATAKKKPASKSTIRKKATAKKKTAATTKTQATTNNTAVKKKAKAAKKAPIKKKKKAAAKKKPAKRKAKKA